MRGNHDFQKKQKIFLSTRRPTRWEGILIFKKSKSGTFLKKKIEFISFARKLDYLSSPFLLPFPSSTLNFHSSFPQTEAHYTRHHTFLHSSATHHTTSSHLPHSSSQPLSKHYYNTNSQPMYVKTTCYMLFLLTLTNFFINSTPPFQIIKVTYLLLSSAINYMIQHTPS